MDLRPPLQEVAWRLARACEGVGVDYAIIGGLAAGAYGAKRRPAAKPPCSAKPSR